MISTQETLLISKYSDEILEVVYGQDELTTSDLQGRVQAIVMNILNTGKKMGVKNNG